MIKSSRVWGVTALLAACFLAWQGWAAMAWMLATASLLLEVLAAVVDVGLCHTAVGRSRVALMAVVDSDDLKDVEGAVTRTAAFFDADGPPEA